MRVYVDFYKPSGKWYAGGEVEIGEVEGWNRDKVLEVVIKNQRIIKPGWEEEFIAVVRNWSEDENEFVNYLFIPQYCYRKISDINYTVEFSAETGEAAVQCFNCGQAILVYGLNEKESVEAVCRFCGFKLCCQWDGNVLRVYQIKPE